MRDCDLLSVLLSKFICHLLVKYVNLGGSEFPRADAFLEKKIQLGKGTAGRFRDPEIGVDEAEEADPSLLSP